MNNKARKERRDKEKETHAAQLLELASQFFALVVAVHVGYIHYLVLPLTLKLIAKHEAEKRKRKKNFIFDRFSPFKFPSLGTFVCIAYKTVNEEPPLPPP